MARTGSTAYLRAVLAAFLLVMLMPFGARADEWSEAQSVTVVATEYAFTPKNLSFRKGVAYRLRIDNKGSETHEFTAPEFFAAIRVRNPQIIGADRTEIVVQPGRHKDLYFIAQQPGSYKLRCSDHDWAGMLGDITVAP